MPKIQTLGGPRKRRWFEYEGSVEEGTILLFTGKPFVSSELYYAALGSFSGRTIKGGFSMTDPPSGGFGEWVRENSSTFGRRLTPRHGSFIAAILVSEGYIESSLEGNSVILQFPTHEITRSKESFGEMKKLAELISRRNRVNLEIAHLIGRPALPSHIGEYIASRIFNIELESSATSKGIDGRFTEGALKGRTVNIKLYGKREGLLDVSLGNLADFYLVMTGPEAPLTTSKGTTRPIVISNVYLFQMGYLVGELRERGVKIDDATSVARKYWDAAEIFPRRNSLMILTREQVDMLTLFS